MKLRNIIKASLVAVFAAGLMATCATTKAQAEVIAPTTPAFNIYENQPLGVGNESDFVRLRKSNGDPRVPNTTNPFSDPISAVCNPGEKFDVRTYIHNGASEAANDNGNGSAVAHNVNVAMSAPLNEQSRVFTFSSTVSASNADSKTNTGRLVCEKNVKLKLVPHTVDVYHVNSNTWVDAPDSAVNGNLRIGSRVAGSGDVWGCWQDRVIVVYTVEVVEDTPQPSSGVCTLLQLSQLGDRRVTAKITGTATNAQIVGYEINWGDGSAVSPLQEDTHQFGIGTFKVVGRVQVRLANGSTVWASAGTCEAPLTFTEKKDNCPMPGKTHLPVNSPECSTPPPVTTLPKTGAESAMGIVAATSLAGTFGHRIYYALRRRFNV